jgi:hypothetical protein
MPDRFRTEVTYFMTLPGTAGVPALAAQEYWIGLEDARRWLDDGTFQLVSPLDAAAKAEIELSEDHERWLEWIVQHQIQHVRLSSRAEQ